MYTKGPWVVDYGGSVGHIKSMAYRDGDISAGRFPRTPTVCRYDVHVLTIPEAEQKANACLIAAAPELLESLEEAYNQVQELCRTFGVPAPEDSFKRYEDAISKAKMSIVRV